MKKAYSLSKVLAAVVLISLASPVAAQQNSNNPGNPHTATYPVNSLTSSPNIDFENGDFLYWTGYIGFNSNSTQPLTILGTAIVTCGQDFGINTCCYHTLTTNNMTAAYTEPIGRDYYSGDSVCPAAFGNYTARLGGEVINKAWSYCPDSYNPGGTFARGEILEYTFTVDPFNAFLTYSSMVLLNTGGSSHADYQQPYFKVEVVDASGNPVLTCPQIFEYATFGSPPPGFLQSVYLANGTQVWYRPWSSFSGDLSSYLGQSVTIRFTAVGCTLGGHFGYAYIDVKSGPAISTGIHEIQNLNSAFFSPNPFSGETTLNLNFSPFDDTKLIIYDALGKQVFEKRIAGSKTVINFPAAEGIYFYQVLSSTKTLARGKIVAE
jgi:hypothetical protein